MPPLVYTPLTASGSIVGQLGPLSLQFIGNTGTPSSVIISATNASAVTTGNLAQFFIDGVTVNATGSSAGEGAGILAGGVNGDPGTILFGSNVVFGACAVAHIQGVGIGGQVIWAGGSGGYKVSGTTPVHTLASGPGGYVNVSGAAIDITSALSFATAFAQANLGGQIGFVGSTFTGSASSVTGVRYLTATGGGINTNGGGATFLPGNSAGTATSPGWYI